MILQSYRKAENTATIMQQRGYGNHNPTRRCQSNTYLKISDLILLIIILFGLYFIEINMSRYKITIQYDGTNYFGWQMQSHKAHHTK